jgi:hypothetical protein
MINNHLAMKIKVNEYFFNPHIITGKRISLENLEYLQAQWGISYQKSKFISRADFDEMLENRHKPKEEGVFFKADKLLFDIPDNLSFTKKT